MGLIARIRMYRLRVIAEAVVILQTSTDSDEWLEAFHRIPHKLRTSTDWRNAHIHEPYNRKTRRALLRGIDKMVFG